MEYIIGYFVSEDIAKGMDAHARTAEQTLYARDLWMKLTALVGMDIGAFSVRVHAALTLLKKVLCGIERLGPMTEEYLRKLFRYGEQAIRIFEVTLSHKYGGRKINFGKLVAGTAPEVKSMSMKDKRPFRRTLILSHVHCLFNLEIDDSDRVEVASALVLQMCSNDAMVLPRSAGERIKLPEIGKLKGGKVDNGWEAEMHHFCSYGVMAVAQCLGHRFMRWPVEVQDQIVPMTGDEKREVLRDWQAVEDQCEDKDCRTQ